MSRVRALIASSLAAIAPLAGACAPSQQGVGADVWVYAGGLEKVLLVDGVGVVDGVWRDGETLLAGALTPDEFVGLIQAFQVRTVVNLASNEFMQREAGFDEERLVRDLGAAYLHLPPAPGQVQSPERANEVGRVLAGLEGTVLLHSGVLSDAAGHWFALRVLRGGLDPLGEARAYMRVVSGVQVFPVEGFTGKRLFPEGVTTGEAPLGEMAPVTPLETPLSSAPVGTMQRIDDPPGVEAMAVDGRFALSGQPTAQALQAMAAEELRLLVNLRREDEMRQVGFDERALAQRLGIDYLHLPSGWAGDAYTTESVDRFAQATQEVGGRALIHAMTTWRAAHFWAAHLHRHRGVLADDALRRALAPVGSWPLTSFERYAGVELEWGLIRAVGDGP